MKTTSLLLLCLAINLTSFSQDFDKRLEKTYSKSQLITMKNENLAQFNMLNYALDNALYVIEMPVEKMSQIQGTIAYDQKNKATFLELGLTITKENQYFKIKDTNKVLVVKSEWLLMNELNSRR
ncbi:MAG: hypothetical protein KA521_07815 [Crocinitomicaceae bacterium]|nr:hypothetical protein [Crocinitomicaceae bacterium]